MRPAESSAFQRLREGWPGHATGAELRVLSASGQLGLGIPEAAFTAGVARAPHVIAADMGSADPGPAYLGSGRMAAPEALVRRDLALVLGAARAADVPLLIGSAGTAGAAPHLAESAALLREVARDAGLTFRLALIHADLSEAPLLKALAEGRLAPIGGITTDAAAIRGARATGQMGLSAFARALEAGADVVFAGRACDTAPFAVVPILLGFPEGPAMHMAKILECCSLACEPGGRDAMLATLQGVAFTLESMGAGRAATPRSVAAHALYEQADPHRIDEPEGHADLSGATYEAVDARRCRVQGATWHRRARPSVRVEGAQRVGHRAVMIAAAADPSFISASGTLVAEAKAAARSLVPPDPSMPWRLEIRRTGIDGVVDWPDPPAPPMPPFAPSPPDAAGPDTAPSDPIQSDGARPDAHPPGPVAPANTPGTARRAEALPREIGLVADVLAPDSATALAVLAATRQHLMHAGFPGRRATAGNLAFPIVPAEFDVGPAYAFTLCHILDLPDRAALDALFPVTIEEVTP